MAHVDSALAGVLERDKWRRRVEVLELSLRELLDKRRQLEVRLRQVRDELQKLERSARDYVELAGSRGFSEVLRVRP